VIVGVVICRHRDTSCGRIAQAGTARRRLQQRDAWLSGVVAANISPKDKNGSAAMIGWRGRLGFLVPPGNPTVETEMIAMAPEGVSLHFHRMVAHGTPGSLAGQTERNRSMVENIDNGIELLAMVKPDVIVVAHTATSYHLGHRGEAELLERLERAIGRRVVTAFGSVVRALERLCIRKLALGTPYSAEVTLQGKAHLEAHGFEVVKFDNLKGIENIYDTTAEHAYALARSVDAADAEGVFLSDTGMPTVTVLEVREQDLGKPVISSASAMIWHALRLAGVGHSIMGYGRLLTIR
jgi:maleate cis-trans isomerase